MVVAWSELPREVRAEVEAYACGVTTVKPVSHGMNSAFTAVLATNSGQVFCKGNPLDRPGPSLRIEAAVNTLLPRDLVPELLWQVETETWLLLGFTYAEGEHANLAPGSSDVPRVVELLHELGARLTPAPPNRLRPLTRRWADMNIWRTLADDPQLDPWAREHLGQLMAWEARAASLVEGDTLTHTDLNAQNILLGSRAAIVDWAWPAIAAGWCDTAFLVPQLILHGNSPTEAEAIARRLPAFAAADPDALTAFAVAASGITERQRRAAPSAATHALADARLSWTRHRLTPCGRY
jgi:hypothetical protein